MPKLVNAKEMIEDIVKKKLTEEGYVQVIRCKDCEYYDKDDLAAGKRLCFCYHHAEFRTNDYFCASGEKR